MENRKGKYFSIIKIQKAFEDEWIEILFSNKDIELFVLEHYIYYNKQNSDYIKEIKKFESNYVKWKKDITKRIFEDIIENNLENLLDNMKKLQQFHHGGWKTHIYDMNPYSEVVNLVKYAKTVT
jgi:hypothetical protein